MADALIQVAASAIDLANTDTPPRRVKLLPIGRVEMRDGRGPFMVRDQAHAARIVAETRTWLGSTDMLFDYDHQSVYSAGEGRGGTAIAAGWAKADSLTADADGIYAEVEWTPAAAQKIAAREYRYLSPLFLAAQGSGEVVRLKNAALVNMGAIDLPAIAASASLNSPSQMEEIAAMDLTSENLRHLQNGWRALFTEGWGGVDPLRDKIAMTVKSSGRDENYGWLGAMPQMREWLGDRIVNQIGFHDWTIKNKDFEATIEVERNDIQDDRLGTYSPMFRDFGRLSNEFPDKLLAQLIGGGFASLCYDGQYFFDTDHPVLDENGNAYSVSNVQAGAGPAWYLLDLSRAVKPFIYQERMPFQLVAKDNVTDDNVFWRKKFVYGTDGRCNVGYGLWQLAYASKAELTPENYELARAAIGNQHGDKGHKLGTRVTHLMVPMALEGPARRLIKNQLDADGGSNPWIDSAELIVTPWL